MCVPRYHAQRSPPACAIGEFVKRYNTRRPLQRQFRVVRGLTGQQTVVTAVHGPAHAAGVLRQHGLRAPNLRQPTQRVARELPQQAAPSPREPAARSALKPVPRLADRADVVPSVEEALPLPQHCGHEVLHRPVGRVEKRSAGVLQELPQSPQFPLAVAPRQHPRGRRKHHHRPDFVEYGVSGGVTQQPLDVTHHVLLQRGKRWSFSQERRGLPPLLRRLGPWFPGGEDRASCATPARSDCRGGAWSALLRSDTDQGPGLYGASLYTCRS
jgi:hypothetical protein